MKVELDWLVKVLMYGVCVCKCGGVFVSWLPLLEVSVKLLCQDPIPSFWMSSGQPH